jgi:[ribosomal protein S18]-alanine N-acetyltransferase
MASLPKSSLRAAVHWRTLAEVDLLEVADLEAQIHAWPWTIGNFHDALSAGYVAHVGERGGRIVAYGVLMLAPGEAQILNLSVVAGARREGVGRMLLRRMVDDARRAKVEQLFLEVRTSNRAAIGLYEAEGFAPVARRIGYYPAAAPDAPREDALVMRRALHDGVPGSY